MVSKVYNFTLERDVTFRKLITWKDSVGNPVNLTGYTISMPLLDSTNTLVRTLTDSNGGILVTPTQGQITIYISAANTSTLTLKKYSYTLNVTSPSNGDVTRLLKGKVSVE